MSPKKIVEKSRERQLDLIAICDHNTAENAAATNAVDDLILWASFPATDISSRDFGAVSVFGTADGLTTIDAIERSTDDLPEGTSFVTVNGAIHSHFGDYGLQPGDGEPTMPRDVAQDRIVQATLDFLSG